MSPPRALVWLVLAAAALLLTALLVDLRVRVVVVIHRAAPAAAVVPERSELPAPRENSSPKIYFRRGRAGARRPVSCDRRGRKAARGV